MLGYIIIMFLLIIRLILRYIIPIFPLRYMRIVFTNIPKPLKFVESSIYIYIYIYVKLYLYACLAL